MSQFDRVLQLCKGKTIQDIGYLSENDGTLNGVRIFLADGTTVQFLYDMGEQEFVAQEVEGCD